MDHLKPTKSSCMELIYFEEATGKHWGDSDAAKLHSAINVTPFPRITQKTSFFIKKHNVTRHNQIRTALPEDSHEQWFGSKHKCETEPLSQNHIMQ